MKRIINISEVAQMQNPAPMPDEVKGRYEGATLGLVSQLLGAKKLGYNVTVLPPGKRAFPFHNHVANEELFFVLEGEGEVRIGTERFPIKKGDFIAAPAGTGTEHAHQIINTSTEELRYLAVSTRISPEVAEYPDSGKFGVLTEDFRFIGKPSESLSYWEGE
ncbi:MAG TPA: cupin domain-containing protein [Candidatus Paceibacterota bacterium]|jgi:uncharacterized cupin superfamily protein